MIVADDRSVPQIDYSTESQTWVPTDNPLPKDAADADRPWIGMFNDNRPTPAELLRADALDGHTVRLADGNDWLIPVARGFHETQGAGLVNVCRLPRAIRRVGGEWQREGVLGRYAALWAGAVRWWDYYTGKVEAAADPGADGETTPVPLSFDESLDLATLALATNYRVGADELGLATLFDEAVVRDVLLALIDWPFVRTWTPKKKAADLTIGG